MQGMKAEGIIKIQVKGKRVFFSKDITRFVFDKPITITEGSTVKITYTLDPVAQELKEAILTVIKGKGKKR